MAITTELTDNRTLLIRLDERLMFNDLREFRLAYEQTFDRSRHKIQIDFARTTHIDSSALGMLLNMQRFCQQRDGEIQLININPSIMKIFTISHFDQRFSLQ